MTDPKSKIHQTARDLMHSRQYAVFHLADGHEIVFIPCDVSQRRDDAGDLVWLSVGLVWNPDTMEEEYACVFLARVLFITPLTRQPEIAD